MVNDFMGRLSVTTTKGVVEIWEFVKGKIGRWRLAIEEDTPQWLDLGLKGACVVRGRGRNALAL